MVADPMSLGDGWIRTATLVLALSIAPLCGASSSHTLQAPVPAHAPLSPVDLEEACTGSWIGVLEPEVPAQARKKRAAGHGADRPQAYSEPSYRPTAGHRCPEDWEPLFGSVGWRSLPPGLQRFCRFTGPPDEDPRGRYREIDNGRLRYPLRDDSKKGYLGKEYPKKEYFERIYRDCRVVGPAATMFQPKPVADALKARFLQEAGTLQTAPSPQDVRLVIIDSVRDGYDGSPEEICPRAVKPGDYECSLHGWALMRLAGELLCGGADCEVVETRRVLRWTWKVKTAGRPEEVRLADGEDPRSHGGFSGDWSDLALAIQRAVAAWWNGGAGPRLILNLSVGWEALYGTEVPAVRAAIEDAVCRGALLTAAAGNRIAGPQYLDQPLLPAAWEELLAPIPEECPEVIGQAAFDQLPPAPDKEPDYRPLLYAVGGVQRDGRPLSNSRPNATPHLVAYGDHASVFYQLPDPAPPPGSATPPLLDHIVTTTGTSVSTLVVSAAAAALWSTRSKLSSFEVMDLLRKSDEVIEQPVDFCLDLGSGCSRTARRVFVGPSPLSKSPPWPEGPPPAEPGLAETHTSMPPSFIQVPGCNPQILGLDELPGSGAELCPQRLFDIKIEPRVGPQPEATHNPNCTFSQDSPGMLTLEFEACYRIKGLPVTISDITLISGDKSYRLTNESYVLGDQERCPEDPDHHKPVHLVFTDLELDDTHPMYLAVTVNGERATLSPLLRVDYDE